MKMRLNRQPWEMFLPIRGDNLAEDYAEAKTRWFRLPAWKRLIYRLMN